jgi:diaminohydroxyphosphoribosylaminopyrimidine deaminase/5-amino-6-(5-phosphoribosylamino)uracil reductase
MSLDGRLATRTGDSKWISGEESRRRVHELRGRVDAILVGSRTVRADDPQLTARPPGPRTATRIVLTATGDLPEHCRLRSTARESPVLVFTTTGTEPKLAAWQSDGAGVIGVPVGDGGVSIDAVLAELGRRRMTNVLVEGGSTLLASLFDARAVDEAWVFVAPVLIGGTAPNAARGPERLAEALRASDVSVEQVGDDALVIARFPVRW